MNKEVIGQVYKTFDYDQFKRIDGNRIIKCLGGQIEETPTCTFDQINLRDNKNYKICFCT